MAVYQFRIKGSGSVGNVKYTDGMNVEVADTSAGKGENPWNTRVERIFVQEFANKYHVKTNDLSAIKMLFKPDRCDVAEL